MTNQPSGLVLLVLVLIMSQANLSVAQTNVAPLVTGVSQIVSPGAPGPVYGDDLIWSAVAAGDDDTTTPSTFAIARTYGSGRVVVMGHDGLIGSLGLLDNKQFALNVLSWLDSSGAKAVGFTEGHGEWVTAATLSGLNSELTSRGYTLQQMNGPLTAPSLQARSVLIVGNAWTEFSAAEISAVQSFVTAAAGFFPVDLPSVLETNSSVRNTYVQAHLWLKLPGTEFAVVDPERLKVYEFYKGMIGAYPQFFRKTPAFNAASFPAIMGRTWEVTRYV